jgi:hypothetical protein
LSAVAHIKEYKTGKFYRDEFRGDISWNGYEHNVLLRNEGMVPAEGENQRQTLRFTDVAMALGADDVKDGRGMAIADFNNDGALDIVINNNPGDSGDTPGSRPSLLRNNIGSRRNWLAVELIGTQSNRDGVGATVTIETGDGKTVAVGFRSSGFASQNSARLYFGLNAATQVAALTVRWPSGRVQKFERAGNLPIEARHLIRIAEGSQIEQLSLQESKPRRPSLSMEKLMSRVIVIDDRDSVADLLVKQLSESPAIDCCQRAPQCEDGFGGHLSGGYAVFLKEHDIDTVVYSAPRRGRGVDLSDAASVFRSAPKQASRILFYFRALWFMARVPTTRA